MNQKYPQTMTLLSVFHHFTLFSSEEAKLHQMMNWKDFSKLVATKTKLLSACCGRCAATAPRQSQNESNLSEC